MVQAIILNAPWQKAIENVCKNILKDGNDIFQIDIKDVLNFFIYLEIIGICVRTENVRNYINLISGLYFA